MRLRTRGWLLFVGLCDASETPPTARPTAATTASANRSRPPRLRARSRCMCLSPRLQSPARMCALAFIGLSFRCREGQPRLAVVLLARAGAARLPAGDELEPARVDCQRVAAVRGVDRVDRPCGHVHRG